jgi:magnesium-transporting ATPase (P-type)
MPKLQRMSVLVQDLQEPENTYIITKGSPEMIFSLSVKETSTYFVLINFSFFYILVPARTRRVVKNHEIKD